MSASVTVDVFVSVDGFAGSDGLPGYFGYFGPDLGSWITTEAAAAHTVLMGRRTYEVLASLPAEHRDDSWEAMTNVPTVVFSRTLHEVDWPGARLHAQDAVAEVRRLKASDDVAPLRTTGSLSIARQLLAAGLVDRLRVLTFPLFAGPAGREPAFADVTSAELQVADTRILDGRIQLTEYRPTEHDVPRGTEHRAAATTTQVTSRRPHRNQACGVAAYQEGSADLPVSGARLQICRRRAPLGGHDDRRPAIGDWPGQNYHMVGCLPPPSACDAARMVRIAQCRVRR